MWNSSKAIKQFGLTMPISLDEPLLEDVQRTKDLQGVLESFDLFESRHELSLRVEVLTEINVLFKQWIKELAIAKLMPALAADQLGGKLYTFGSYRLGVQQKGADIDALCVAPLIIERSDFFKSFFELLKKQPKVTGCLAVEDASVPVIKMNFAGIEVDLLLARLSLDRIQDDLNLSDHNLLKNLDQNSVRSLNGCRVTDEILALVPNVTTFRLTLRTIKLWAKQHGIYSNSLGYFGGVTWAILVARVCQLYPNAAAATIVQKFFLIYTRWEWPKPLLLKRPDNVNLRLPVWDPRIHLADRQHLMPIITPSYPQQNSTFNVSQSTKKVILDEIKRGFEVTEEIMKGRLSWAQLFEAPSFFYRHRHFLVLFANSQTATDHLAWCGLVESKIRLLISSLDSSHHISLAHVHPKCFDYKKTAEEQKDAERRLPKDEVTSSAFTSMWFIALEFENVDQLNVNLTDCLQVFVDQVNNFGKKIGVMNDGMSVAIRHAKRKQLSQYLDAEYLALERQLMKKYEEVSQTILANRKQTTPKKANSNQPAPKMTNCKRFASDNWQSQGQFKQHAKRQKLA